jgi:DNA-binding Xre family transcriptional regulator
MLSREEIKVIWESKKWEGEHYIDYIGFAEAVMEALKKASEK